MDQSVLSQDPSLEPHLVTAAGLLNLDLRTTVERQPEGYQLQVRGTRDKWQVVGWPVTYGPETPVSVCFESDGDIRVGDAKGSDDCAKIPCL